MKKKLIFVFLFLAALFAAVVAPVGFHSTVAGMRRAVQDSPGSWMYQSDNLIVMVWTYGQKYAWATISKTGEVVQNLAFMRNGQCADCTTIAQFTYWLETHGFQRAFTQDLPAEIVATLTSFRMYLVSLAQETLPSFLMVPAAIIPTSILSEGELQ